MKSKLKDKSVDADSRPFEKWVYPKPIPDLEEWAKGGLIDAFDPKVLQRAYWPDGKYKEDPSILVVGCGANQAACIAYHNPKAHVTGIDISQAAIAHENTLKDKHKLDNLTLKDIAAENVATLKQEFDLIIATGVLNYTPQPATALKALSKVLHADGTLALMLYGHYPRVGINMLRDFFKSLGLKDEPEDIEVIKAALRNLRPEHYAVLYLQNTLDLNNDAGLVHTFLYPEARDYTVSDCLALLAESDLNFMGWTENFLYYPDGQIAANSPLMARLLDMPEADVWKSMELFLGRIFRHCFYACKSDRPESTYQIRFDGDDFLNYIPHRRIDSITQPDPASNKLATIQRAMFPAVPLDNNQAVLFNQIDGKNTIRECIEKAQLQGEPDAIQSFARNFFRSMWRIGYAFIQLPGQPGG